MRTRTARPFVAPRRFEQVERAGDVGIDVKLRLADRRPHARASGEVDDGVEPTFTHDPAHGVRVAQVRVVEHDVVTHGGEVAVLDARIVIIVEVVEHGDPVAVGQQGLDQMRADESGAAGNEDFHKGLPGT